MKIFNLSSRIVLFSICTSLEYDLKKIILGYDRVEIAESMLRKAEERNKAINLDSNKEILNELDLGDLIEIICRNPYNFKINNEKGRLLYNYFKKIIPVRNRVMHTRPLELGDRSILFEVLDSIEDELSWFRWIETNKTKLIISENPSSLLESEYKISLDYNSKIYHNLPIPEFDDTGYIGRKREMVEIEQLLLNKKNQIISIVGNGGIGKTAITVKILYDLIDNDDNDFEAIIWLSLKTRTLSKGEFKLIVDSINSLSSMFECGVENIIKEDGFTSEENIINFMKEFKVLLVLDNLETINSDEIIDFLKSIPENSKVLITSRLGIGELEYRYLLGGLNMNDALIYYRELSKYFGLELHKVNDNEIKPLINNQLYSNPLSIKWYITGIYNGMDKNSLIANKDSLIEFCMSNVFEKLTQLSKKILQLFLIHNLELNYGEIDYFINVDEVELRKSINELLTTNMVRVTSGKYTLNSMAKDYIALYHKPSNEFMLSIIKKKQRLNSLLQEIKIRNENDPFNPRSLFKNLQNGNRKLASYYLTQSLEYSSKHNWEEAIKLVDKAASISPNYFEIYKIKAFILAEKNDYYGAINNYEIAIDKCEDGFEKATILYLYSIFYTIKLPELEKALELITEAERLCSNEIYILLEKSRILMYLGKYSDAEEILLKLDGVEDKIKSKKLENIYASRYADLMRRKAERYEKRDVKLKLNCFREGIKKIEEVSVIDTKTYIILTYILKELSYLYFDEGAMQLLYEVLQKHFSSLKSINHRNIKKIRDNLFAHKFEIPSNLFAAINKYIYDYKADAKLIEEDDCGIITFMKDHFGFIANSHFPKGIYFSVNNAYESVKVGDKVSFETYDGYKGIAAKDIKLLVK